MKRGEVWWAHVDQRRPVVLLSAADDEAERQALQVVPAATPAEKHGYAILSGPEAVEAAAKNHLLPLMDWALLGVGVEIAIGADEGLQPEGVIRIGLPRPRSTFCTWLVTLRRADQMERVGSLSKIKQGQLDAALRLADHFGRVPRS